MYYKGNNMLHMIRQIVDNDSTWKNILRGIQDKFYHQTVTADQVERYIIEQSGKDLDDIFDQYLHYADIPTLQYYIQNDVLHYRWQADVSQFDMPLEVTLNEQGYSFIYPTTNHWRQTPISIENKSEFSINPNYYIKTDSMITEP
jgi:aminopeptidase N